MLNIVIINCEGRYEEYEWPSKEAFVQEIESNGENVPMLDNILTEVNTQDENLQSWWEHMSDMNTMTVNDLFEKCK